VRNHGNKQIRGVVEEAFLKTHEGRSTDDVVIDDGLNRNFIRAASRIMPGVAARDLNWQLLNLRKSGKLGPVTSVRYTLPKREEFIHAVEMAARFMEDRHHVTIDRFLCDPVMRPEFDRIASGIAPGYSPYVYRKAALGLRKGSKLKPELLKRIMRAGMATSLTDAERLTDDPESVPRLPGVYIFADNSGALYIGESENLRLRVLKQLDHSDRKTLAHYLWENGIKKIKVELIAFEKGHLGSSAAERRALEASLIASRHPRFNIQHSEE